MIQTKFQSCIEACLKCVAICNQCAIACLNEDDVAHVKKCIQLDLECAAICQAAANVLSLDGKFSKEICKLCADICNPVPARIPRSRANPFAWFYNLKH